MCEYLRSFTHWCCIFSNLFAPLVIIHSIEAKTPSKIVGGPAREACKNISLPPVSPKLVKRAIQNIKNIRFVSCLMISLNWLKIN